MEAIATFAHGFVESLQEEQRERYKKDFKNKPKEFRTSPEKQVGFIWTVGLPELHVYWPLPYVIQG